MKRAHILLLTVAFVFASAQGIAGNIDEFFNKALESSGEEYYKDRDAFLKSADKEHLLKFLDAKLKTAKAPFLKKLSLIYLKSALKRKRNRGIQNI